MQDQIFPAAGGNGAQEQKFFLPPFAGTKVQDQGILPATGGNKVYRNKKQMEPS